MMRIFLPLCVLWVFSTFCGAQDYSVTQTTLGFTSISGSGTNQGLNFLDKDEGEFNIAVPFNFQFFTTGVVAGTDVLRLGANGAVSFQSSVSISFDNTDLTSASAPNNSIFLGWDDLDFSNSGSIYSELQGIAPNRVWIIEYSLVPSYFTSPSVTTLDAQLAIFETSNVIELRYSSSNVFGSSVSSGLKDTSGTKARGFPGTSAAQPSPTMNLRFTPNFGSPELTFTRIDVATQDPRFAIVGESVLVSVNIRNQSPTSASTNFPVNVYLSTDTTIDINDQFLGSFTGGTQVNAGQTVTLNQNFTIPTPNPTNPNQVYHLGVFADPTNTQMETVRQDNTITRQLTVLGGPSSLPYNLVSQRRGAFASIVGQSGTNTLQSAVSVDFDDLLISRPLGLPFDFQFFGTTMTANSTFQLSSNGWIGFGDFSNVGSSPSNRSLPDGLAPNSVIAFFWDDLIGRRTANAAISDRVDGAAPHRVWTIEYSNMEHFSPSTPGRFSCQIVLTETANTILFRYNEQTPFTNASATIGLEDNLGVAGISGVMTGPFSSSLPSVDLEFQPGSGPSPLVDLVASSLSLASNSVTISGGLNLTSLITNSGTIDSGPFQVSFYLSTDSMISNTDLLLATESVSFLAAGRTFLMSTTIALPQNFRPGLGFLGMIVNDGNSPQVEATTTNNSIVLANILVIEPDNGLLGDFNNDGLVDIGDLMTCVDKVLNDPGNLNHDLNFDGQVDILDLQIAINRVLGVP